MKKIAWLILLGLAVATITFSCQEEDFEKVAYKKNQMSVEDAKAWFESNYSETLFLKQESQGDGEQKEKEIRPWWYDAQASNNNYVEIVEARIESNAAFGFSTEDSYRQWQSTENSGYLSSLTRLVILRYKTTGDTVSFFMTHIGDKDYLEKKEFNLLENGYLKRDADFSGMIFYHSLEGKFVNGWSFKDGEVVSTLTPAKDTDELSGRLKSTTCYTTAVYEITDYYTEWSVNGEFDHLQFRYRETELLYEYQICNYSPSEEELNNPEIYTSGNTGGYKPSPSTTSSPKIIIDPSFEKTAADCVMKKLQKESTIRHLVGGFNLDESKIDLTFKVADLVGINGRCRYNLNTKKMEITIDTDRLNKSSLQIARTILHETFHAYMYGKLYDKEIHTTLAPEPDFETDFKEYRKKYGQEQHHNYMADKYITHMKKGLEEYFLFQNGNNTPFLNYVTGSNYWYGTDFMLECLAWGGLKETDAWKEYCKLPQKLEKYNQQMRFIVPFLNKEKCKE